MLRANYYLLQLHTIATADRDTPIQQSLEGEIVAVHLEMVN